MLIHLRSLKKLTMNNQNNSNVFKVPVYKLQDYKKNLKHFYSFSEHVSRCNFSIKSGWSTAVGGLGKTYVYEHGLDEYKPDDLRGVAVLDLYYIKSSDYVILTEEQYKDFRLVLGDK